MSPGLPYLPGGVSELPAEKFVLFADGTNQVQRIDESAVQKDGVSFIGIWESGTLNQLKEGFEFTLSQLELLYTAISTTTVTVKVSGDGGETFDAGQAMALPATVNRVGRSVVSFDGLEEATGFDLRFRIEFDTDLLVNIYGYRPHLVERSDLIL